MMDRDALQRLLAGVLEEGELLRDEPMSAHTTFAVGGPADFLVRPHDARGVRAALEAARAADAPFHVIGRGSNLLVSDAGLRGVVVEIGPRMSSIGVDGTSVRTQAGATNGEVAAAAAAAGLAGYEFASGIPGSIGGAAVMNAGAYGGEFGDVCEGVTCLTPEGEVREVAADEAAWGYRRSMMMEAGWIVLSAVLRLRPGDPGEIRARMAELAERRASRQPLELASAGSTFKRPEGHFAGKLIQDAGMRGHAVGPAMVSERHCGFVVNAGGASAAQVLQVIRDVQEAVWREAGVRLEPEVRLWGFDA